MRSLQQARERGATSLEYAGFIAVAALVVGAIFLGIAGGSSPLARGVTGALCQLFSLGQGSCEMPSAADDHIPPEPCVVNAQGHESKIKAGIAVFGGGGERWLVEELSDGTFKVTRGTSSSLGLEGGAGFSVTGIWGDKTVGVEAGTQMDATAFVNDGEVYNLPNEQAAQDLIWGHYSDIAKDKTVGGKDIGIPMTDFSIPNPIRWGADQASDLAGVPDLPEADEEYFEGGASANASASATWLVANAQIGAGVQGVLGVREGKDGSTSTYYSASFDASVSAGTWASGDDGGTVYGNVKAGGKVDGAIEVKRGKDGEVTSVVVKFGGQGEAYAGENDPGTGTRWEQTIELPADTTTNQQITADFLNAMNMGPVPGLPGYVPNPLAGGVATKNPIDMATSTASFLAAAQSDGYLSRQTFTTDDDKYGANFDAKWIAKVGGNLSVSKTTLTSKDAQFFNGQAWVPWEGCAA